MAETEGFEPSRPFWGSAHLANECLQPLGHVSGASPYAEPLPALQAARLIYVEEKTSAGIPKLPQCRRGG